MAAVALLAGCGASDSTVSKTPAAPAAPVQTAPPAPSPTVASGPSATPAPADPCAINLAAPEIAKAVSELPRDPRSGQPWSSEPLAGNYNECAPLSAIVVKANTNADNPNTRAPLLHLVQVLP